MQQAAFGISHDADCSSIQSMHEHVTTSSKGYCILFSFMPLVGTVSACRPAGFWHLLPGVPLQQDLLMTSMRLPQAIAGKLHQHMHSVILPCWL